MANIRNPRAGEAEAAESQAMGQLETSPQNNKVGDPSGTTPKIDCGLQPHAHAQVHTHKINHLKSPHTTTNLLHLFLSF